MDIGKLRNYCLNSQHNTGKHKAHLFTTLLGMGPDDAEALRDALLEAIKTQEAQLGKKNEHGQRYTVDFTLKWRHNQATIRSGWIIETTSDIPKLATAFPLVRRK